VYVSKPVLGMPLINPGSVLKIPRRKTEIIEIISTLFAHVYRLEFSLAFSYAGPEILTFTNLWQKTHITENMNTNAYPNLKNTALLIKGDNSTLVRTLFKVKHISIAKIYRLISIRYPKLSS